LCSKNGAFSGSSSTSDLPKLQLSLFFSCYQGNLHAKIGLHAVMHGPPHLGRFPSFSECRGSLRERGWVSRSLEFGAGVPPRPVQLAQSANRDRNLAATSGDVFVTVLHPISAAFAVNSLAWASLARTTLMPAFA
jgi:hypothetical protein